MEDGQDLLNFLNLVLHRKMRYFFFFMFFAITGNVFAQKDGIRGYGSFEFLELNTFGGKAYTNGGGGIILNNNLLFGVYVSTLTKPFRWDLFTSLNNPNLDQPQLTNNELATNSTINNFDVGGRFGFNIAPAKSLQTTLSLKIGYSTINYLESYVDQSVDANDPMLQNLPVLPLEINHTNYNLSPQLDLQFRVGKAFKISAIFGYKIQRTTIRSPDLFPDIDNLLIDNRIFEGSYGGFGFTFGNL